MQHVDLMSITDSAKGVTEFALVITRTVAVPLE
jgi:hypothetical protein